MGPTSPTARRIILHLLRHRGTVVARRVADELGTAPASTNDVLRYLAFHGALGPKPERRVR